MPYPRLTKCMPNETRHNPFHDLHKVLRLGHCRMLAALGAQNFEDPARTAELLKDFGRLIALNRRHAEAELSAIYPAVEAACPGITAEAAQDLNGHLAALAELESLVRAVQVAIPARRNIAGQSLYRCYALFAASDMARMDKEETELLASLHRCLADTALREIEMRVLQALPPEDRGTCAELAVPAFSATERAGALAKLGSAVAPADVTPRLSA